MIVRIALASLALVAAPAFAGTGVADTHTQVSSPSGKSAHHAYRPIANVEKRAVIHTIPAGKINHAQTAHNHRVAQAQAARAERLALSDTAAARD